MLLHAGGPAPGCSYQAEYRGAFVCTSRARIFSLEFSFLLSSHPPPDTSWHFSCRQSKATAFFFSFFNGCSFSYLWVVGEGDVISTANTARASLGMRGSFRMEIGPCQPSCVYVSMTKRLLLKTWLFSFLDPCCFQASCSPLSWQPLTSPAPGKRKSNPACGGTKPEQPPSWDTNPCPHCPQVCPLCSGPDRRHHCNCFSTEICPVFSYSITAPPRKSWQRESTYN